MALTITIDGVDRTDYVYRSPGGQGSIRYTYTLQSDWKADLPLFDLNSTSSAYRPSLGESVLIENGSTVEFHGRIDAIVDQPVAGTGTGTLSLASCKSLAAILDQIEVNEDYSGVADLVIANSSIANPTSITTNQPHGLVTGDRIRIEGHEGSSPTIDGDRVVTVTSHSTFTIPVNNAASGGGGTVRRIYTRESLVTDLFNTYLNAEGFTLDAAMSTGPDIEAPVFKEVSVKRAFDYIATITNEMWRIHPDGDELQFFAAGEKTASYSLTAANRLSIGAVMWEQDLYGYANDIRVRYGGEGVKAHVDSFTLDGSTNVFALTLVPALRPDTTPLTQGYVEEAGDIRYPMGMLSDILTSSVANPTTITTSRPHGLDTGQTVVIQSHSGSTPSINGSHTVTMTGLYTFTIPVNVTVAGTGGSAYQSGLTWLYYQTTNSLFRVGAGTSEVIATLGYSVQFPQTAAAEDAAEISARGRFTKTYTAPDVFSPYVADELAAGLLEHDVELPRKVTISTRQGLVLPGDQITLTFANRLLSGSHLVTTVSAVDALLDGTMEYTLTCVSGSVPADTRLDRFRRATGGGVSGGASGGTVSGRAFPTPSGRSAANLVAQSGSSTEQVEVGAVSAGGVQSLVTGHRFTDNDNQWVVGVRPAQSPGSSGYEYVWFNADLSTAYPTLRLVQDGVNVIMALDATFTGTVRGVQLGENSSGKRFASVHTLGLYIGSAQVGAFTTPTFSAGNFTASSGSWTVASGDVITYAYEVTKNKMTLLFEIHTTDVSATPAHLRIAIPGGYTAAKLTRNPIKVIDAGAAAATGEAVVNASGTYIECYKDLNGTTWTAGANTYVMGQITFETS